MKWFTLGIGLLFFLQIDALSQSKLAHYSINGLFEVDIYTPAAFNASHKYPIVYFNDGEFVFNGLTGWNLQPILDSLISIGSIEPMVVVAVYANGHRLDWYLPYHDNFVRSDWGLYEPQAAMYTQQFHEVIIPYVESLFQIDTTRRAIFGASFGGLHSTWAALSTNYFSFSAAFSPSYWVGDYAMLNDPPVKHNNKIKLWFDIGTAEWNYYVPLIRQLNSFGLRQNQDIYYLEIPGARHSPAYWRQRVGYPLKIFSKSFLNRPSSIELHIECIPSQSIPGKTFQRLNPIIETESGVKYSLTETATYTIINGNGKIEKDGRFMVKSKKMDVSISYQHFYERIILQNCR